MRELVRFTDIDMDEGESETAKIWSKEKNIPKVKKCKNDIFL